MRVTLFAVRLFAIDVK